MAPPLPLQSLLSPVNAVALGRIPAQGRTARKLALVLFFLTILACSRAPRYFEPEPGVDFSRGMLHLVQKGDTLSAVSLYYRRDTRLLAYLNEIGPPYELHRGEYLYIPPDNSDEILRSGKMTLEKIHNIRRDAGQKISRPGEGVAIASPAKKRGGVSSYFTRGPRRSRSGGGPTQARWKGGARDEPEDTTHAPAPDPKFGFVWPVEGTYSRGFARSGWRKFHMGVDIAAPEGAPIRAANNGTVIFSGKTADIPAYGNMVVIDHGNGFSTVYAHCARTLVDRGRKVKQNQLIARVGSTGNATASHLHLELRYNGTAVDPEKYFPALPKGSVIAEREK